MSQFEHKSVDILQVIETVKMKCLGCYQFLPSFAYKTASHLIDLAKCSNYMVC